MDFTLEPGDLTRIGTGLHRPECVLCTAGGDIFASRWPGGVTRIHTDGRQTDYIANDPERAASIGTNGFAITETGDFLLANLHDTGGVWRLQPDGQAAPFLMEIDGQPLPPANYVGVDSRGRVWISVSTRHEPRALAYRPDVADGFVILVDEKGPRIAADNIGYTNEAIVNAAGDALYVNETMARRTSRYAISDNGTLGPRETVAEYGAGTFPDGLAFDSEGGIWITSVVSNRVIYVAPDGDQHLVLEEADPAHLQKVEDAFQSNIMGREHLDGITTKVMRSISSLAFGGPDLKTAYLGNLLDDSLYCFRSPIAGMPMSHWSCRFP